LPFNFYPARIFLGDCGALFLGFVLSVLSVLSSRTDSGAVAITIPIVLLGVPILDTVLAVTRRLLKGRNPFQGDRDHLHHRLLALGLSQPMAVLTMCCASGLFAITSLVLAHSTRVQGAVILLGVVGLVIVALRRLQVPEIQEVWHIVRYGERRRHHRGRGALLAEGSLNLLRQCNSEEALRKLLDTIREELEFGRLRIRFEAGALAHTMSGLSSCELTAPHLSRSSSVQEGGGEGIWVGRARIFCYMCDSRKGSPRGTCRTGGDCVFSGSGCVIGEVVASKSVPWRRRATEDDVELLERLADGVGQWVLARYPRPPLASAFVDNDKR
jgi:hypothetical protein